MKKKSSDIFLLKNTPEDVLATHALAHDSIQIIHGAVRSLDNELPDYTVWISREEDLHDFVYQVPDLAWDMLEYADEPLEILFPQRKYFSPLNEKAEDHLSIRLLKTPKLINFVRKNGPLLSFPLKKNDDTRMARETIILSEKDMPYHQVKSMKLFDDSSFTFVR